ncbi:MAG TPA: hypothetical protein VJA26_11775 [Gammaproteobacteria bacterium]|nr:hypothetical protein [Gammaproteobacteria bacterium]
MVPAPAELASEAPWAWSALTTNVHGNLRTGTQIITAPFGLAPVDFDLYLGLFTYLKKLPELPSDG